MKGSCLCGNISFEAHGTPMHGTYCHCSQCRKQSGHYWAAVSFRREDVAITGDVTWYRASDIARRGFCARCGSVMFWDPDTEERIAVSLGAVDGPTGLKIDRHIFTEFKGDYYEIPDAGGASE